MKAGEEGGGLLVDLASLAHAVVLAGDEVAHSLIAVLQGTLDVCALPAPLGSHVLPPPLDVCQPSLHGATSSSTVLQTFNRDSQTDRQTDRQTGRFIDLTVLDFYDRGHLSLVLYLLEDRHADTQASTNRHACMLMLFATC